MIRYLSRCMLSALVIGCLGAATLSPASAIVVFDDHFDGNSGGMPANWHLLGGSGSVMEAGTTVTLYDDIVIVSDSFVDPSQNVVVLTMDLAGTNARFGAGVGFADLLTGNRFGCSLYPSNGMIEVGAADIEGGEQHYIAGYVDGYTGGAIQLTITMEPTTFTISTDSPPFSTGPVSYAAAFATFTREDLGSAVNLMLVDDVAEGETGWSSFDRLTVDVQESTPVQQSTFGRIKALYLR